MQDDGTMSGDPFFSVVIPSYNRAQFLGKTISSVQQQTCPNFELLLVDDGSRDNTEGVVTSLAKTDKRIRYIFQNNAERGAARNNGIRQAKGKYVVFFDSDDEMKADYLQLLFSAIASHPQINFIAAKYNFIRNGREFPSTMAPFSEGFYGKEVILKGNPFACNFCIRRENRQLVLFEEDRNLATTEDWMFLVENLQQDKIFIIDKVAVLMLQHEGRSMGQNALLIERRIKATERLCRKISFTKKQQDQLWAYTFVFCSVHAYLDYQKSNAIFYLRKAAALAGWNRYFALTLLKYVVGRKFIEKIKAIRTR